MPTRIMTDYRETWCPRQSFILIVGLNRPSQSEYRKKERAARGIRPPSQNKQTNPIQPVYRQAHRWTLEKNQPARLPGQGPIPASFLVPIVVLNNLFEFRGAFKIGGNDFPFDQVLTDVAEVFDFVLLRCQFFR